uniref:F-box domain-containing protein n=1 Tax=Mycena chlorophos TaxID=658473 RepID=A0ABQ0M574_MYCCL|nr:predicted protein [Mycena chlorophos]
MNDFPTELVREIFALAISLVRQHTPPVDLEAAPWTLVRVCVLWRTVALSFPELWSTIIISAADHRNFPRDQHCLELQLRRSANAPLDIVLRMARFSWQEWEEGLGGMAELLARESARWRSLHILGFSDWWPHQSFNDIVSLPLLERVALSGFSFQLSAEQYAGDAAFLFRDAPRLDYVIMNGPDEFAVHLTPESTVPWSQIRTYKAQYALWEQHVPSLGLMAGNLVSADISLHPETRHLVWNEPRLEFPSLRRLVVSHHVILDFVTAPALTELHVHGSVRQVPVFLQRTACKIRQLTLYECSSIAAKILEVLGGMSETLEHLAIEIDGDGGTPLRVLDGLRLAPSDQGQLCPNLVSIAWWNVPNDGDRDALMAMVWSRWRVPLRNLRMFTLLLNSRLVRGRDWYQLRQEGLQVKLVTESKVVKAIKEWREYFPVV